MNKSDIIDGFCMFLAGVTVTVMFFWAAGVI